MRINKNNKVFQVYKQNQGIKKPNTGKLNNSKDQVKISEKAMDFQFALQKLKEVEEVRMDKVEKIRQEIDSGTYVVDGKKIAAKMMEGIGFDKKS